MTAFDRAHPVAKALRGGGRPHMDTSRRITKAIERFLRAHADELDPGCDPAVAAVVVETTVEALAHKALAERRAMLTNGRLERETFRLATRYLSPS